MTELEDVRLPRPAHFTIVQFTIVKFWLVAIVVVEHGIVNSLLCAARGSTFRRGCPGADVARIPFAGAGLRWKGWRPLAWQSWMSRARRAVAVHGVPSVDACEVNAGPAVPWASPLDELSHSLEGTLSVASQGRSPQDAQPDSLSMTPNGTTIPS